ncbi:hypothetical protein ACFLZZ_00655 [Nanoarchaeota archaeon]
MEKDEIIEGILYLLQFEGELAFTLLEIKDFLKLNGIKEYSEDEGHWRKLKELLVEIENQELIEERHFGKEYHGRVDYSIENPGTQRIKDKQKELKEKWKFPEWFENHE